MTREQAYDIFNRNHAAARPLMERLYAAGTPEGEKVLLDQQIHNLALESVEAGRAVLSNFEGDVLVFLAARHEGDVTIEMVEKLMKNPVMSALVAITTAADYDANLVEAMGIQVVELPESFGQTVN